MDCRANLSQQLFALALRQAGLAHKLGVRVDCGEVMAKIVRNGACHATDGSQSFRLHELLLRLLQLRAHPLKGSTKLAYLFGAFVFKVKRVISASYSAH